jgi:CheY-like chemotaxis protein
VSAPARILVAEDQPDLANFIAEYLRMKGHEVSLVFDGLELAKSAVDLLPHLIISDIQMPGAYGPSAYEILQTQDKTKDIPIVFISALPVAGFTPDGQRTRFLSKPIDLKKLDAVLAELLPLGGWRP